jgi:hypothetical protein
MFGNFYLQIGKNEAYFRLGMGPNIGPCEGTDKSVICSDID